MGGGLGTIQDENDEGDDSDFSGDADEQINKQKLMVVQEKPDGDLSDDDDNDDN